MNKNIIIAAFLGLALTVTGLTSCKKCMECKYTESSTNVPRKRDACGNKDVLDLFKKDVIKEAKSFGVPEEEVKCAYK